MNRAKSKGFTVLELIIAACIVLVCISATFSLLDRALNGTKVMALKVELGGLRHSIYLYKILNGGYPPDLRSLVQKGYILAANERVPRPYFIASGLDSQNVPVDPFGNTYEYDSQLGYVWSKTTGYQNL